MNTARLSPNQYREISRKHAKLAKLENSKSEYRNSKQTMRQTKSKYPIIQTSKSARFESFFVLVI